MLRRNLVQCSQRGQRTDKTIRSEWVKSHWLAWFPAASAARTRNPRWRLRARVRKCSRQIPVSPETSCSVNIFWLDLMVTTALPFDLGSLRVCSMLATLTLPMMLRVAYKLPETACNSRSVLAGRDYWASTLVSYSSQRRGLPRYAEDCEGVIFQEQKARESCFPRFFSKTRIRVPLEITGKNGTCRELLDKIRMPHRMKHLWYLQRRERKKRA